MAKKKKKQQIDSLQIIASAVLFISFVTYFRLFFIGGWLYYILELIIGNVLVLLFIIDLFSVLFLLKKQKIVTRLEWIGSLLLFCSINFIGQKGLLFTNITKILSVIITENLTFLLFFVMFLVAMVLLVSRYKNLIFRELDFRLKNTNSKLIEYKDKYEETKLKKFREVKKLDNHNYISTFIQQAPSETQIIFNSIPDNHISEYANSIYQYVDDIKTAVIKIFENNDQEIIFTHELISIENIVIKFKTKEVINKRHIVDKISKVIPKSKLIERSNLWTLELDYDSNILISIKDQIVNYVENEKETIGITKYGNLVDAEYFENYFINYENSFVLNKFLDILFLQKSVNNEKFIIVDFQKLILKSYINKENVLYEEISTMKNLISLIKLIETDINEKREYASDLGYDSYESYARAHEINTDKINVVFNEITTISLKDTSHLYNKLLNIVKISKKYGYNFIFTNSKESKEVINSRLYNICKNKLFFATKTNSFSKLLVKTKELKNLNNTFAFYIIVNKKLKKIYFPGNDQHKDLISNFINESLEKSSVLQNRLETMWIVDDLVENNISKNIISVTYLMTKYKIQKEQASEIVELYKQMR